MTSIPKFGVPSYPKGRARIKYTTNRIDGERTKICACAHKDREDFNN